jgi:hypothetical protein
MDDDAQLERDLLLARRLKLGVRLVFYPLLIAALLLALHIRHAQAAGGDDDPAPVLGTTPAPVVWNATRGNLGFTAWTSADRVIGFNGVLVLACSDGTPFELRTRLLQSDLTDNGNTAQYRSGAKHGRSDDGGTFIYSERFGAERTGAVVSVGWEGSVVWTRGDTGRVVRCKGQIGILLQRGA